MTDFLSYNSYYLVGIKGVAMTALANCLLDAGKHVAGSDVQESFVTQPQLNARQVKIDFTFDPSRIIDPQNKPDCVIYTAAHGGPANQQVMAALKAGLPTFSHAQALGMLFDTKDGIAVCGVGGKSTTSAMIAFILEKYAKTEAQKPSYAIGVGGISGLDQTGQWITNSTYFVAEADEYVTDPMATSQGKPITPRFSYLHPKVTVCTNLSFDHPDVYTDFAHTKQVYGEFFANSKPNATLVINADDNELQTLAAQWAKANNGAILSFGTSDQSTFMLHSFTSASGVTTSTISYVDPTSSAKTTLVLTLRIPGKFNAMNAVAAITACSAIGIPITESAKILSSFASTKRRCEFIGTKQGVTYYDDYAHHPNELKQVIQAFKEWYPNQRLVVAFQSHTFSRTKSLFTEFLDALGTAREIVMIDIFPSARETFDPTMTSDLLCQAITTAHPDTKAENLGTIESMANYCKTQLNPGDVFLTLGAGDIYHVHELVS